MPDGVKLTHPRVCGHPSWEAAHACIPHLSPARLSIHCSVDTGLHEYHISVKSPRQKATRTKAPQQKAPYDKCPPTLSRLRISPLTINTLGQMPHCKMPPPVKNPLIAYSPHHEFDNFGKQILILMYAYLCLQNTDPLLWIVATDLQGTFFFRIFRDGILSRDI